MSYCTPAQFIDGPGISQEVSELFQVELALLLATIAGDDRSAWTADEIAVADAALVSIESFLAQAASEIEARLAVRGYSLPQSAVQFPILTTWARKIARYHVQPMRDKTNDETGRVERDYREALRALDLVAAGKLSLGAGDPLAPTAPTSRGTAEHCAPPRVFDRNTLADY